MAVRGKSQKRPVWAESGGSSRKRGKTYRRRPQNVFSMVTIIMCILVVMLAITLNAMSMKRKIDDYNIQIQELQAEIAKEEERAKEIEEYRKYTQTKGFVEETAQNVLGLVYDSEILFKQE